MADSRRSARPTLTAAQRKKQQEAALARKTAQAKAAKTAAAKKKADAAAKKVAATKKAREQRIAAMNRLTPAQRKAVIQRESARTSKKTGFVGPTVPSRTSAARKKYNESRTKPTVQTVGRKITKAENDKRRRDSSPAAMAAYDKKQKAAKDLKTKAGKVSKEVKARTASFKKTVAARKANAGKETPFPSAPKLPAPGSSTRSTPSVPVRAKAKPQTAKQKAYTKDSRNKEYDKLRKAGKTAEAEKLGKQIAADARKKAPKNPFRAPQGKERKDKSYKAVQQLKALRPAEKKSTASSAPNGLVSTPTPDVNTAQGRPKKKKKNQPLF